MAQLQVVEEVGAHVVRVASGLRSTNRTDLAMVQALVLTTQLTAGIARGLRACREIPSTPPRRHDRRVRDRRGPAR